MNLLTKTPVCHKELFNYSIANNRMVKTPKDEYTLDQLKDYIKYSANPVEIRSNYTSQSHIDYLKKEALKHAPNLTEVETAKLLTLIDKFGLEVILYTIDLIDFDVAQKSVIDSITENTYEGEVILASLLRNQQENK